MLTAIDAARRSVRLETYIFTSSPLGDTFRDALVRACGRDVRVQVLVDAFGSVELPDAYWDPLRRAGGAVRWFNPLSFRRPTFRDHRKLLVCDEHVAFVGGFNIAGEFEGDGVQRGWRDVGLEVEGALALELTASFDMMFERADDEHVPFTRFRRSTARVEVVCPEGELLLSGPGRGRNAIKRAVLGDLKTARRVRIVAAYFLPTGRLRWALTRVVRRGGRVQLILPGRSDIALSQMAARSFYRGLLEAGVEIHEYQPQVLHSKLVLIDEAVYVGSSNLDARSLHINYELMVRLTQPEIMTEAVELLDDHLRHSRRIEPQDWERQRTWWDRLRGRWARFLLARLDLLLMRRQLRRLADRAAGPA